MRSQTISSSEHMQLPFTGYARLSAPRWDSGKVQSLPLCALSQPVHSCFYLR